MKEKDYIVIVQCHIVKERCSGYMCERAFHERTGGFVNYPADKAYRTLYLTCGGCCGRALHRKLNNLIHKSKNKEGIEKDTDRRQAVLVHYQGQFPRPCLPAP